MVAAWYALIVGILISLDGIILLIFEVEGFASPNWYIGLMLIVGVIGIILGTVSVTKEKRSGVQGNKSKEEVEEDVLE